MKPWYTTDENLPCTMIDICNNVWGVERVVKLTCEEKNWITRASIGYLLRIYQFKHMLGMLQRSTTLSIEEIRQLRHGIICDFRTVLGLKLAIIRSCAREMHGGPRRLRKEFAKINELITKPELQLRETDRAIYNSLAEMNLWEPLQRLIPELPNDSIPMHSQVVKECQDFLVKWNDWLGKFVNRKHRFIMTSQNMQYHDIVAEIQWKAINTFYLLTPFYEIEHRENLVKRTMHNHGIQMITHFTKDDNSRLRFDTTNNEWYNLLRLAPTDQDNGEQSSELNTSSHNIGLASFSRLDNMMIISNYVAKHGKFAGKVLQLLAMQDDNEFCQFAQKSYGNGEFTNNELIFQTIGRKRYLQLIAKYLQCERQAVKTVVTDMQQLLRA